MKKLILLLLFVSLLFAGTEIYSVSSVTSADISENLPSNVVTDNYSISVSVPELITPLLHADDYLGTGETGDDITISAGSGQEGVLTHIPIAYNQKIAVGWQLIAVPYGEAVSVSVMVADMLADGISVSTVTIYDNATSSDIVYSPSTGTTNFSIQYGDAVYVNSNTNGYFELDELVDARTQYVFGVEWNDMGKLICDLEMTASEFTDIINITSNRMARIYWMEYGSWSYYNCETHCGENIVLDGSFGLHLKFNTATTWNPTIGQGGDLTLRSGQGSFGSGDISLEVASSELSNPGDITFKIGTGGDGYVGGDIILSAGLGNNASNGTIQLLMGNVGIGTSTPTALLHLAAGTATNPSLKFEAGTLLTTPETGSIEYDGNKFYITNNGKQKAIDRTSDVALETVTVSNTITETTLWTGEMGANSLDAGNVFKFHCDGLISNGGPSSTDEVILRVKVGGNTVVSLHPVTKTLSDTLWHVEANAIQRTIGVSGERAIHIHLVIGNPNTTGDEVVVIATTTINTTNNMDVTITAQWASADAANTISLYQGFMEYKN